jgi:hypothetical protein
VVSRLSLVRERHHPRLHRITDQALKGTQIGVRSCRMRLYADEPRRPAAVFADGPGGAIRLLGGHFDDAHDESIRAFLTPSNEYIFITAVVKYWLLKQLDILTPFHKNTKAFYIAKKAVIE